MKIATQLLESPIVQRLYRGYRRLFSVHEIEANTTLQLFFGAMLLFFFVTFSQWATSLQLSADIETICWPHFPNCNDLHFLSHLPHSYTQGMFYMLLFSLMLGIAYLMYKKWWTGAHAILLVLLVWKAFASFLLSWGIAGVYDYYHIFLTATLLLVPHKEYFTKLVFVMLYFLSSTIKFYPAWTLGTYFTTLELGLPIFPDSLTPLITNFVIFEQVVGAWFLLSKNRYLQRFTLLYAIAFHLYGGVLVLYNYSTVSLPTLLILFGPLYRHQFPPLRKTAIAGWCMIAALIAFQSPVHFIKGDEKMTLEGYRFGMWMFDSNHQCVSNFTVHYKDDVARESYEYEAAPGTPCQGHMCMTRDRVQALNGRWVREIRIESPKAEVRCAPYTTWQSRAYLCAENVERVAFTFDHSVNGQPFYRVVDVEDMCGLTYKTFGHNEWIKEPPEAPAVGIPVRNVYY